MLALRAPFLLSCAPALHARLYKHKFAPARWQKLQRAAPEAPHSHHHYYQVLLPLAQVEGVEAVPAASSVTPVEAPPLTDLVAISLGLLLIFWLGNFVVPDFIFNKVFKQEESKQGASTTDEQSRLDGGNKDLTAGSSMEETTVKGTDSGKSSKRLKN